MPGYYNPSDGIPVNRLAFKPTDRDDKGLSVFREDCGTTPAQAASAGPNPQGYYVARLEVAEVTPFGISIEPDPQPGPLGHALIPELSITSYNANKNTSKELMLKLAEIASRAIVHSPQ